MPADLNLSRLPTTPPCCSGWAAIEGHLSWGRVADSPHVRVMPTLAWVHVRYCPCCGADRAGVLINPAVPAPVTMTTEED